MGNIKLISKSNDGHRSAFVSAFQRILDDYRLEDKLKSGSDFYLMLDEDLPSFFMSGIKNFFLGKNTIGLFFRPGECFRRGSVKYKLKKIIFSAAAKSNLFRILTIIPHSVDKRFAKVSNGWIYDPQFWDLPYLPEPKLVHELAAGVINKANGRRICVALGGQSDEKGFAFFARLWLSNALIRQKFLFVAGGRVSPELQSLAAEVAAAGGLILDRFVSDDELATLYEIADCIWSCYSPAYNQSSGILGRAFQLGKPSIVRSGSYMSSLADELFHPTLPLQYDDERQAADALLNWKPSRVDKAVANEKVEGIRKRDLKVLLACLGVDPAAYKSPLQLGLA